MNIHRGGFLLLLSGLTMSCAQTPSKNRALEGRPAQIKHEVVETYHPLSTQIGYDILHQGGNAFDAFVAATTADYVLG